MTKSTTLLFLACAVSAFAQGTQLSDEQFAGKFRCPESFATDEERNRATNDFLTWARSQHGDWTMDQLIAYRVRLLQEHHCDKTLANIRAHSREAK